MLSQKEKDGKKEAERKTEEMRANIYSLQTEKRELDSKILEMHSTISSLQDEQRTIGSALEEKQNEIKTLREKEAEADKENAGVVALMETLKHKEDEIQGMKNRLANSNQVLPVSTDDSSKQAVSFSQTDASSEEHEASGDERTKGASESLKESTTSQEGDTSRSGEGRGEEGRGLSDTSEKTGGHSQNNTVEVQGQKISEPNESTGEHSENSTEEVQRERIKDLLDSGMQEDKANAYTTETMANQGDKLRTQDESNEGKANGIGDVEEVENVSSQGDTTQQLVKNATGEMKLEMSDNSQDGAGQEVRAKHGRYKELRDAELEKLDRRGNNQDAELVKDISVQESESVKVDGNHQQDESIEVEIEDGVRLDRGEGNNSGKEAEKAVVFADENGKGGNNDIDQQIEKVQKGESENFEKPNGTAADADKQKSDEMQLQSGGDDSEIRQKTEMRDGDKDDQNSEEAQALPVEDNMSEETDEPEF